jgi:dUTP pyrophosphatase
MDLNFKKLSENAVTPFKKYVVDAGFDLTATWKKETDKYTVYGTDIAFEIPPGYVGLMFPRSSVTNQDLILKNCVGVIDASYRGEIMCRFSKYHHDMWVEYKTPDDGGYNERDIPNIDIKPVVREPNYYEVGDRVCQVVFLELPFISLREQKELSETERGTAGYGSTGKK